MSSHTGRSGMGLHKHGNLGHVQTPAHFTGKQGPAAKKRKRGKTRKQRRLTQGAHVNKYALEG